MLRLPQSPLSDLFVLFEKLAEPSIFLLIHGQNSHPAPSVKMALQSGKRRGFFGLFR